MKYFIFILLDLSKSKLPCETEFRNLCVFKHKTVPEGGGGRENQFSI